MSVSVVQDIISVKYSLCPIDYYIIVWIILCLQAIAYYYFTIIQLYIYYLFLIIILRQLLYYIHMYITYQQYYCIHNILIITQYYIIYNICIYRYQIYVMTVCHIFPITIPYGAIGAIRLCIGAIGVMGIHPPLSYPVFA